MANWAGLKRAMIGFHLFLIAICLCGCTGFARNRSSNTGPARGAVDILLAGQGIADEYSVNITGCQHDFRAHQLIFSGEEMAAFFPKRPEALRISDPGTPLQITAFRKGVPLTFNPTGCKTARVTTGGTGGEVDLSCNENGSKLTVVIVGFSKCGSKE